MEDNQKKETSNMQKTFNISQMRIQEMQMNNSKEIPHPFNKYFITAAGQIVTDNLEKKGSC